ncbi:MAG TPA: alpha/beta hydrolase [Methylomusa anaerophila]|uniref:2,6-dihydropseudooxynicotine hydrolase n=1 Tax=Methylomusa anaerophila TaxID=1930071 RepID=A0A348AIQ7_9FIRM|nr:alpha/beta hydrolase [Methylomusa anaerophila]BBB90955.1 2,6-dihydropseudooxynicotine hydrolase [Methylomusa anaerophila]HML90418.1 alpha/beta hydrolase [Methylomusa anaerophila]
MSENRKSPVFQNFNRLMAGGFDHTDYTRMVNRVGRGEDHVQVCEELGDKSYAYAEEELQKGHQETAKIFFIKAAADYRIAEYDIVEISDERLRIYGKLLDSHARGLQLYDNFTAEKVEIPYKNSKMSGWMLIPRQAAPDVPVIVAIGGLTGFKEEVHTVAMSLINRGLAVLLIDGPGQGESLYFNKCYLEIEIEQAYDVIFDYILSRSDVGNKIGIFGASFGGYFVPRIAGFLSHKLAGCVSRGGSYEPKEMVGKYPHSLEKLAIRFGTTEKYVTENLLDKMTLQGIAEKITCPLLIIHNEQDPLFNVAGVKRTYAEAAATDKTIKLYPGVDHCVTLDDTEVHRYFVDWFADRLLA